MTKPSSFAALLPLEQQLEVLANLLESEEEIPHDLALSCASAIRAALSNKGKFPLRPRGRPAKTKEAFIRASDVASLISEKGMTRDGAIEEVSRKYHLDVETISKNYDKHRVTIQRLEKLVKSASLD